MGMLRQAGMDVELVVVRIGVSGAIYQETVQQMVNLGVDRSVALATLKAVHIHSVRYLSKFVKFRRKGGGVKTKKCQTSGVT